MLGFLKTLFGDAKPAQPAAKASAPAPRRAELIGEALKIHRAKRKIFDELSDDSRAKLVAMTVLTMLNQGDAPDRDKS